MTEGFVLIRGGGRGSGFSIDLEVYVPIGVFEASGCDSGDCCSDRRPTTPLGFEGLLVRGVQSEGQVSENLLSFDG